MERNVEVQGLRSRLVSQWQPAILVAACLAGGLTLTTMVIGSTPDVVVQASEAAIEAAPDAAMASDAQIVAEAPVDTSPIAAAAGAVDPVANDAAAATSSAAAAASLESATVAPAPGPAPAMPSPMGTASPTPATPSAPAPVAAPAPPTPVTVAAPQAPAAPTTAAPPPTSAALAPTSAALAPTSAAPAPTTAAPAPTTAAPVAAALTYPLFSAGSAATVVLQFDGSSIYVASVARQPDWVSQVDKNGPRTVEIKFFNTATGRDEEFHATVEGGRIKVEN
jgi:hypothetical protein